MPFVVDASVAIAWAFNEQQPIAAQARARLRTEEAIVPALWWYELRNVLVLGERRGRLTERDTARFLRNMSRLAISMDSSPSELQVLTLARRHRLTVYDAAYLELAQRQALPLATLDGELATAARTEQVAVIGAEIH
jgi:predicted nucleic acid-binding protein